MAIDVLLFAFAFVFAIFSAVLFLSVAFFAAQILFAFVRHQPKEFDELVERPRVALLIPAHNEAVVLGRTLAAILPQLGDRDRLLVVADNCTDETALIARGLGAEVVERCDSDRRGKGFALDYGIKHLSASPPQVVIVVDADCQLSPGFVDVMGTECMRRNRPVQALDLMVAPRGGAIENQVAEFAWRIKNWLRPLGMRNLGLPCQLMGTGMGFPWAIISTAQLATSHLVEDLKLGLDLTGEGYSPYFLTSVKVQSEFPNSSSAAQHQRSRWDQGRLGLSAALGPKLILAGIRTRNFNLLGLAIDMMIPPLGLLGFGLLVGLLASFAGIYFGMPKGFLVLNALSVSLFFAVVGLAWGLRGRDILPVSRFPIAFKYILRKFSLFARILGGRGPEKWVRTDRDS